MENQTCIHTIYGEHGPMSVDIRKLPTDERLHAVYTVPAESLYRFKPTLAGYEASSLPWRFAE